MKTRHLNHICPNFHILIIIYLYITSVIVLIFIKYTKIVYIALTFHLFYQNYMMLQYESSEGKKQNTTLYRKFEHLILLYVKQKQDTSPKNRTIVNRMQCRPNVGFQSITVYPGYTVYILQCSKQRNENSTSDENIHA